MLHVLPGAENTAGGRPSGFIKPGTVAPRYTRNRFFSLTRDAKIAAFLNVTGKFSLP